MRQVAFCLTETELLTSSSQPQPTIISHLFRQTFHFLYRVGQKLGVVWDSYLPTSSAPMTPICSPFSTDLLYDHLARLPSLPSWSESPSTRIWSIQQPPGWCPGLRPHLPSSTGQAECSGEDEVVPLLCSNPPATLTRLRAKATSCSDPRGVSIPTSMTLRRSVPSSAPWVPFLVSH